MYKKNNDSDSSQLILLKMNNYWVLFTLLELYFDTNYLVNNSIRCSLVILRTR